MLKAYLQQRQQMLFENQTDFYTSNGIHVFFKDKIDNEAVDPEKVVSDLESIIPNHLMQEVEMIIVGWFDEFEEQNINAFYEDGTLYISNVQTDNTDMLDDLIHEVSHSLEQYYGLEIYGDKKIETEFLKKRKYLHDVLWKLGYKIPLASFMESEYNYDFDMFLYKKIGYDKLSKLVAGILITPYAVTSLREYYATGFTEFFLHPNEHNYLKRISPELYKKLLTLQNPENLDN